MAYFEKEREERRVKIDELSLREKFTEALQGEGFAGDAAAVAGNLVDIVRSNVREEAPAHGETEEIRIFGPGHKRRLSEQWGIEHAYSIPLLGQIAQNGDAGTPFILDSPDSPAADVFRRLAESVVSEVAKTKAERAAGGGRPEVTYDAVAHVIRVGGDGSTLAPARLRRACRCAACVEELTGRQILEPRSVPESVWPRSMSPTGNYALSVDWSDGHRSLYPYRQIRSMLTAEGGGVAEAGPDETAEGTVIPACSGPCCGP